MMYAEASYFDGYHFAHIAAYEDAKRLKRITKAVEAASRGRVETVYEVRLVA